MTRRALPLWGAALLVFAVSRLWSTALLAGMFALAKAQHWSFASSRIARDFVSFSASWDASFYRSIAEHGYPSTLPMANGHVVPNEWAFLPVFPALVRGVALTTGLSPDLSGIIVSVLAGAGASAVLAVLLAPRVGRRIALWTVALFAFGPLGFLLQVPYAEGLFCLLVFAALLALQRRRYAVTAGLGVIAAFTRPGELALPLAIGILFLIRMRDRSAFRAQERIRMIAAAFITALAGLAWPVIAASASGHAAAYLETELSWWTGYVGRPLFVPLAPWFLLAGRYLGVVGIVLVALVLAATLWWFVRRRHSRLGPELLSFSGSYVLYLVAVFLPQQSLLRLLMPLTPLLADTPLARTRLRRTVTIVVAAALQPVAVVLLWFLGYP